MTLEQAIDKHPLTIPPDTLVTEAIARMSQEKASCVLVVDQQQLVGIFTERDVVKVTATGMSLEGVAIAKVMTRQLITLAISQLPDLDFVVSFLHQHRLSHLPIIDERGEVLGVVTPHNFQAVLLDLLASLEGVLQVVKEQTWQIKQTSQQLQQEVTERQRLEAVLQQTCDHLEEQVEQRTAELRENEKAWQLSQERLDNILGSLEDVVWSFDPRISKLLYLNSATEKVYGRTIGEFFQNLNLWQEVIYPSDRTRVETANLSLRQTGSKDLDYRILRPDGKVRWLRERSRVIYDSNGTPIRIDSIATDITERKQAEEIKAVLLKEIHHRVKNNMQIIISLLDLQAECLNDTQSLNALRDSQTRIRTMALIHEQLYGSENLQQIDFQDYIDSLVRYLVSSYAIDSYSIELKLKIEKVFLDIDTAIPCGLIINELISNALKYAFTEESFGEITIEFHSCDTQQFELVVWDTGRGLPKGVELETANSLGLRLVHSLATIQLEGTIEVDSTCGTRFKINF